MSEWNIMPQAKNKNHNQAHAGANKSNNKKGSGSISAAPAHSAAAAGSSQASASSAAKKSNNNQDRFPAGQDLLPVGEKKAQVVLQDEDEEPSEVRPDIFVLKWFFQKKILVKTHGGRDCFVDSSIG